MASCYPSGYPAAQGMSCEGRALNVHDIQKFQVMVDITLYFIILLRLGRVAMAKKIDRQYPVPRLRVRRDVQAERFQMAPNTVQEKNGGIALTRLNHSRTQSPDIHPAMGEGSSIHGVPVAHDRFPRCVNDSYKR